MNIYPGDIYITCKEYDIEYNDIPFFSALTSIYFINIKYRLYKCNKKALYMYIHAFTCNINVEKWRG